MPFGLICQHYHAAADRLGLEMTTIFLAPPSNEPLSFAQYEALTDLTDAAALARAMQPYKEHSWPLILCHRYRSYKAVLTARLQGRAIVAIAHEYGMMARWQRRIERVVRGRHVQFAGVAPAVAAEVSKSPLTLPNVLDVQAATLSLQSRASARAALGLEPADLIVGVIGRLHYKKRPQLAIEAFKHFRRKQSHAKLVFVGDGPLKTDLQAKLPDALFPGAIPNAASLLTAFDAVLHTGNVDAFGMVIVEAMFAGVPIVAPRGQGPEFILGDLGHYPDEDTAEAFAHALSQALTADAADLLAAGRDRVAAEFSIERLSHHLKGLLAH